MCLGAGAWVLGLGAKAYERKTPARRTGQKFASNTPLVTWVARGEMCFSRAITTPQSLLVRPSSRRWPHCLGLRYLWETACAGCVRIDSELGEMPPEIFGEPVQLEFVAPFRPRDPTSIASVRRVAQTHKIRGRLGSARRPINRRKQRRLSDFAPLRRARGSMPSTPGAVPLTCLTIRARTPLCPAGKRGSGRRLRRGPRRTS